MVLTVPIREILPATPRARIVRLGLREQPFQYAAGQALLVAMPGSEKRRPYSLAAAPEDAEREKRLELLVGLDEMGQPALEVGAEIEVEGPVGTFTFPVHPEERRFMFIAGGTGIAPLRSMLRHALAIPHKAIGLFYSARTPDDFAYEEEFRGLSRAGRIELRQTVTRSTASEWTGARGRIGRADLTALVHDPATLCFICGPPALVEELPKLLQELGIPPPRIKIEEWR